MIFRAVKFERGIRKLGLMEDGVSSYLDGFRTLLTHIGNALGLVRIIKSAAVLHSADVIPYIPDPDILPLFEELLEAATAGPAQAGSGGARPELVEAARLTDTALSNVVTCFNGKNSYFRLLVTVFSKQLTADSHAHLDQFWAILPPLFVNFVQHIMLSKEKLSKNNVMGALVSDDGFALGKLSIFMFWPFSLSRLSLL